MLLVLEDYEMMIIETDLMQQWASICLYVQRKTLRKMLYPITLIITCILFDFKNVSHFVLRLAYCRNQQDRVWFTNQEKYLMKFRLETVDLSEFLSENNLNFDSVSLLI